MPTTKPLIILALLMITVAANAQVKNRAGEVHTEACIWAKTGQVSSEIVYWGGETGNNYILFGRFGTTLKLDGSDEGFVAYGSDQTRCTATECSDSASILIGLPSGESSIVPLV